MRVIAIGAHPDDCDVRFAGTAVRFVAAGHAVKFVSVTNGDAGHHEQGGGALARRRRAEAEEAGRRLGVRYELLDHHDGELVPSLEARNQIIRLIREWRADLVFAPRPHDYHPDHRYTGILVQDAAFLVIVPNVCPDTPPLRSNPVFFYFQDDFQSPASFRPDVAVDIDETWPRKVDAIDAHVSQFYEWLPWLDGALETVPRDTAARRKWLEAHWEPRSTPNDAVRQALVKWYGPERGARIRHAEAFELCEYGSRPKSDELPRLFPFLK